MTGSCVDVEDAARSLYAAQANRTPIPPLTETYPTFTVSQAYRVQQRNLARHLGEGAVLRGHKIGLTSAPMQRLLGVEEPDFGYLLDTAVLGSGATVAVSDFCAPRVEPEVAFRFCAPLHGPGVTAADVMACVDALAPALEIVDSRIVDWRITLADTIADNASCGAAVLGNWLSLPAAPLLPQTVATLSVNGRTVDTGAGSAVMGDPAVAVAWLANALAGYGTGIQAGQFVMSGSYTAAAFVNAGDHVRAAVTGLGEIAVAFT